MTDNDITLPEVYRVIQALVVRVDKGFAESERNGHSLRNKVEATNLKVAVIESQLDGVKEMAEHAADLAESANDAAVIAAKNASTIDPAARWSAAGAALASIAQGAISWFHK